MLRHQQTCRICNKTIQTPSDGRTITSKQENKLKPFLCRDINVGSDRVHNKCYQHPALHCTHQVWHMQFSHERLYTWFCLFMKHIELLFEAEPLMPLYIFMYMHTCIRSMLSHNLIHLRMLLTLWNMKMKRNTSITIRYARIFVYVCMSCHVIYMYICMHACTCLGEYAAAKTIIWG